MMTPADRAKEYVALINDGTDFKAVMDPRSMTPPVFLWTPPRRAYDLSCGFTATWPVYIIAVPPATADAWAQLDKMADAAHDLFDVETFEPVSYPLPGGDTAPAYLFTFTESFDA